MKFDINLLNDNLLPPKTTLSFNQLIQICLGVLIVGIIAISLSTWLLSKQSKQLAHTRAVQAEFSSQQKQLEQQLESNKADNRLISQVNLAKSRLKLKQLLLNELDRRSTINSQGFSPLLTDLASVTMPNLWLTRIHAEDLSLSFEGYSLHAQDVPIWIESLKTTRTLKGFSFAAMTMTRGDKKPLEFLLTSKPLAELNASSKAQ